MGMDLGVEARVDTKAEAVMVVVLWVEVAMAVVVRAEVQWVEVLRAAMAAVVGV